MTTTKEGANRPPSPEDTADNDQKPCGHGRMLRKEDPRFIRGRGNYVDDVALAGMLHLAILRSPYAHARIVMVSSVGYQENILAALQKGAKHFVQKPVKPEVLYEILRYVLSDDPTAAGAPVAFAGEHSS